MAQLKVPDSPDLYYTYYQNLLGIDISKDPTECPRYRAADILNMIPDSTTGIPVKRRGWRVIHDFGQPIVGAYHDKYTGIDIIVDKYHIWRKSGSSYTALFTSVTAADSVSIVPYGGNIYVLAFSQFIKLIGADYTTYEAASFYTPITVISRNPDGTGGSAYEGANAFSQRKQIQFLGNTSSTTYKLYPNGTQDEHLCTDISIELLNSDGVWVSTTEYTLITGQSKDCWNATKTSHSVVQGYYGVTFTSAHAPIVAGQDNVRVTFTELDISESDAGGIYNGAYNVLYQKLTSAKIATAYGANNTDRMFVVVDDNKIYYSAADDLGYIPDDNYLIAGNASPIVGLHRKSGYLVAVTSDSSEHALYMISSQTYEQPRTVLSTEGVTTTQTDTVQYFAVRGATSGTGAISQKSFATLIDDPLFLARTGVYGIYSNSLTSETVIQNRSTNINPRLTQEQHLENAVAGIWNGYYLLAVNSHCYVLDSRVTSRGRTGSTGYECYYWDNIPAVCFLSYEGELFFGTSDGKWCKFNTDVDGMTAWCDNGTINQDNDGNLYMTGGVAIKAMYLTKQDSDDYPQYYKNMNKKGSVITLKPYDKSSVTVSYSKNGSPFTEIGTAQVDIFNFKDIDFSRFTFNASTESQDIYTNKKIKKYKRLQIKFENNVIYEPFGIVQFTKTWTIGNFAKG